jgi:DNA-directed RNA polymerase specialized sigma24 family protein
MAINNNSGLSDKELIVKIKEDIDFLGLVHKKCKLNALHFLKSKTNGTIIDNDFEDVFHDAIILLYEKIVNSEFVLTSSIQTYLNSVCRNQLFNKLGNNRFVELEENQDFDDDEENSNSFKSNITDCLEEIEDSKDAQFIAIEKALLSIKSAGGHCYELLTSFWYHKKSMAELTEIFGYTNSVNTRKQKEKCQKRLNKIVFNELNK